MRLGVDVKAPGVFSARLQLPKGPWIAALLQGAACLIPESHVTLTAHEGHCEVELDGDSGRLLRASERFGNIHSPSQPRGMAKQYAHTTRAQALSLPTRGKGLIYSLRGYIVTE